MEAQSDGNIITGIFSLQNPSYLSQKELNDLATENPMLSPELRENLKLYLDVIRGRKPKAPNVDYTEIGIGLIIDALLEL
jgi:hypothetical protein